MDYSSSANEKIKNIESSGLSIYDAIETGDNDTWLLSEELSETLNAKLIGESFDGLAIRTRSKIAKQLVCKALGYPIPKSFKKTQPRFTGQNFDTYVQKANNLQIWNEELSVERRYVLIRTDENDVVTKVKVITGADLAFLDTTGTLTQKYQAQLSIGEAKNELINSLDTEPMISILSNEQHLLSNFIPTAMPQYQNILPISECFKRLKVIIGQSFADAGATQERNRGAALHALVCKELGYCDYRDDGKFPDIKHQLLEVKLQTSPTIDLGLVCPDSESKLDVESINGVQIRHCDVRYAIFFGEIDNGIVTITNFYLTSGKYFFSRFNQFQGKVLNKKLQIPLPTDFFTKD
jgi:hypothetical protein